jgi:hypothetical protein
MSEYQKAYDALIKTLQQYKSGYMTNDEAITEILSIVAACKEKMGMS